MKVIVTCGPSYEPIDEVRRITNFSTGQLGTELSNYLTAQGHDVICFRGTGSTYRKKNKAKQLIPFSTSSDLAKQLQEVSDPISIRAIFHAAALGDYQVTAIKTPQGDLIHQKKIPTSQGEIILYLKPVLKLLGSLRSWFPQSFIVGWKYEVMGDAITALAKGKQQTQQYQTDACVINGPVAGKKFILYQKKIDNSFILERVAFFEALNRLI